jgi:1-acyl-sn-glycerol-3-phosphate acyltransferase
MRRLADCVMRSLAQMLVRIFFRRIEVEGADRLPRTGPLLVVANHTNGLVDGLLLMSSLGRFPRFLGKSTLFRIPPLWPFLKLAGVIPVYRASDGSTERNATTFAASRRVLAGGGTVALFPEGVSHDESSVRPLRTGVGRIALNADEDDRVRDLAVLAVGLIYDDKPTFRSRALVRVGVPTSVSVLRSGSALDSRHAVRQLTEAVATQLDDVSPPYASWAQAEECAQIAEIVHRRLGNESPTEVELAQRAALAECFASREQRPGAVGDLDELHVAFARYQRDLNVIGLDDQQLVSCTTPGALRRTVAWSAAKVVLALPVAIIGVVIHLVPFQIVKRVAKTPSNEGMKATVKLLGCFFLFALTYAALGVMVGLLFGAGVGAATAVAAPFCGYVALRLFERVKRVGGLVVGYRAIRRSGGGLDAVMVHRRAVLAAAGPLLEPP